MLHLLPECSCHVLTFFHWLLLLHDHEHRCARNNISRPAEGTVGDASRREVEQTASQGAGGNYSARLSPLSPSKTLHIVLHGLPALRREYMSHARTPKNKDVGARHWLREKALYLRRYRGETIRRSFHVMQYSREKPRRSRNLRTSKTTCYVI